MIVSIMDILILSILTQARYLKKAASQEMTLLVAILPDTDNGIKNSYKFSQRERAEGLTALNIIDGIILLKK